jgi:nucleotide-binding universal stress UspA family protein
LRKGNNQEGGEPAAEEERSGKTLILVAVDDSEYSKTVAREASRLALQKKADVVLLSVVPVPSLVASEGEIDEGYLREKEEEFVRLHKKLIEAFFTASSGSLIESRVLHGDPADKIVKHADEVDADLIVIGTRGHGRLASALLGSVSEHVAKHSKRSVLIVKQQKENGPTMAR